MKQFALFTFETYYPGGGWNDFVDTYDNIEDAKARSKGRDNYQVVDLHTGEIVAES